MPDFSDHCGGRGEKNEQPVVKNIFWMCPSEVCSKVHKNICTTFLPLRHAPMDEINIFGNEV